MGVVANAVEVEDGDSIAGSVVADEGEAGRVDWCGDDDERVG